jgi:hypothetical protein
LSVQKLYPDSFGAPRALAICHGILGDFDAIADWLSKAIGQHDPAIQGRRRGLHPGATERLADDLHAQWQAVRRGGYQRRQLYGRAGGVPVAE